MTSVQYSEGGMPISYKRKGSCCVGPADIVSAVQKYCNTGARRHCGPHRAELTSSAYLRTDESHKTDSAMDRTDRRDLGSAKLHPFQFMPIFPLVGFPLKWK